jgi:precorrin-6A/cobalt-precorrin-6A reductase
MIGRPTTTLPSVLLMRVLILGGTTEARELALDLHQREGFTVTSSLAGRLREPHLPVGDIRIGGFEGIDGLVSYLRTHAIDTVVDATHPFAATITDHALRAARSAGRRLIVLHRPGWTEQAGDRWERVPDLAAAAAALDRHPPGTAFLTTGRQGLDAFAADARHHFLIRTVEAPDAPLPPRTTLVLNRGPFTYDDELALLREHGVTVLITKDTGGPMTASKLSASRELAIPVIVVERPGPPSEVAAVRTVDEVVALLLAPEPTG